LASIAIVSQFVLLGLTSMSALPAGSCAAMRGLPEKTEAVVMTEFIFETAPFPSCHASTIAEVKRSLAAAWFGGTQEGVPDVGIWFSRYDGRKWSVPVEVAAGINENGTQRFPCWNPVLFQPTNGPLFLFYKVGPRPAQWWGMMMTSGDGGRSWSKPRRLPDDILGPVKNKPVELPDGILLCPSSTEHAGWRIHLEWTVDLGKTWTKTGPLNDGRKYSAIQPTILLHLDGRLQLLCRSRQGRITECWSADGGKTWGRMRATNLPNPDSGIDAVALKDGRYLLVYNPVSRGRTPLVVGISENGKSWSTAVVLEDNPGEYSYPAVIQSSDGLVHITYTWKRQRIKHVVLDPREITRPTSGGPHEVSL
jgi:predicted neuraminidase